MKIICKVEERRRRGEKKEKKIAKWQNGIGKCLFLEGGEDPLHQLMSSMDWILSEVINSNLNTKRSCF